MANIKVSDQELKAILSELESELQSALGTSLNKSEDGDEKSKSTPPKKDGEGSSSEGGDKAPPPGGEGGEGSGDAPPPAPEGSEGGDVPPPPGADAPPAPGAPAVPPPAAPPAPATPAAAGAPVDPAAAGSQAPALQTDPAALQAEYATLPPDQLKMHYLAAKSALFAATQAAAPAPAAPAPAPAPAAAPPMAPPVPPMGPPGQPPVMKGEKAFSTTLQGKDDANPGGKIPDVARDTTLEGKNGAMNKNAKMPSEQNGKLPNTPTSPDIAKSEKDELAELKLQFEVMTKALSKIAGVPMQKAVTDLTYVAKSEGEVRNTELTAEQIKAKLNEVARNPLTKSEDRALMNKYVCGSVNVDAIKHLLK